MTNDLPDLPDRPEAELRFLSGPLAGVTLRVTQAVVTLGRGVGNDVVLLDPKVSRAHARLLYQDGVWRIERLSRTSVLTVDERVVEEADLGESSHIGLGDVTAFMFLPVRAQTVRAQTAAVPAATAGPMPADPADPANGAPPLALAAVPPAIPHESPHESPQDSAADAPQVPARAAPASLMASPPAARPDEPPLETQLAPPEELGLAFLEVTDHVTGTSMAHALVKASVSIGRDPRNDIVIDEPCVSDFHLQLVRERTQWRLIHPHPERHATEHGLLHNGRQIHGHEVIRSDLRSGERIRIGDEHGIVVSLTYHEGRESAARAPARVRQIPLGTAEVTIGRMRDNTLVLDHPQVSAHHARLTRDGDTYRLIDLGSTNHTYVNGLRVGEQTLHPGEEIRIGPYKLLFESGLIVLYDESGGVRIDALHVTQTGGNGTILLDDVEICFPPRSFVALVGASGAGKSTLLDALSGLRPAASGTVLYNGQDFYQHRAAFSTQIGYVPQDEIIHRDLSVERALYYAAKLRLPEDFTPAQIDQRIEEVLDDVEMRHRRKLLIRQLSGGQRKRVSIALELLASPSLFFLDEPTSGLDPGLDRKMMLLLRKLADKGHTIVLVTHATSNINVCDYVCFLAAGGHVAFFGPPHETTTYFEQPGFAEIYSVLEPTSEHPELPAEVAARFKRSPTYERYVAEPLSHRPLASPSADRASGQPRTWMSRLLGGTGWKQFALLTTRYVELLWNDKRNLVLLLAQAPVIALLLAVFILELDRHDMFQSAALDAQADAQRFIFIMAFSAVMFGCINAAREIVKEAAIFRRERTVNLGILPYLFSKIAILGLLSLLQCAAFILIIALAAPFHQGLFWNALLEGYVSLALTALAGLLMGLAISALVSNNDQAMSYIPLVLIPQVVFSGVIFPLKAIYLQVIGMVFVTRWAMAGLGSSLRLDAIPLGGDRLYGSCATCVIYRQDTHYLLVTWGVLAGILIALTVLTAYLLKRKDVLK